ncbi:alpha/beta fold hydrolase [Kribbella solani]|uniref:alpha/beta fold hydrolase n=1 Tax=Kribbella solani TaxID=236067 RepID=UPI0029BE5044|nr:alpha/beta hydrolase [Kribbella solani]MDX2968148.1 alpha/beta hydrolase [Kribbella solani]
MQDISASSSPPEWFTRALASRAELSVTSVDGLRISHRSWGPVGTPGALLVHGGLAHARWWDHIAPLLTRAGRRRIVALDLSGHGDSGRRDRYSVGTWAREVAGVAAAGGFAGPPVVVGHSMGGIVALRVAVDHAEAIAGTVTVDSRTIEHTDAELAAHDRRSALPARIYPSQEAAIARFRPVPGQPSLPYVRKYIARASVRQYGGGWTWKSDPRVFGGQEFDHGDLSRLSGRVMMLRAEHGLAAVGVDDPLQTAGIPSVEIPAAGHHVMLDQPLALVSALRTLLATWQP